MVSGLSLVPRSSVTSPELSSFPSGLCHLFAQTTATSSLPWPQDFFKFTVSLCHVCVAPTYSRNIWLLLHYFGLWIVYEAFSSPPTSHTTQTFLPWGVTAPLDSIWEKGVGSTGLLCSPITQKYLQLQLCSSTSRAQPKETSIRPLPQGPHQNPNSLFSHWLPVPQSKETLAGADKLCSHHSQIWCSLLLLWFLFPTHHPSQG